MKIDTFTAALQKAFREGDWSDFEHWTLEGCSYSFEYGFNAYHGPFDEEIFEEILRLMRDPRFQHISNAHSVVIMFETDWSQLSEEQKERLLPYLEKAYGHFSDEMVQFVIAELLGRFYRTETALEVIRRLRQSRVEKDIVYLPMALGYLARFATHSSVAQQALNDLLQMQTDPYESVREEVEHTLFLIQEENSHHLVLP